MFAPSHQRSTPPSPWSFVLSPKDCLCTGPRAASRQRHPSWTGVTLCKGRRPPARTAPAASHACRWSGTQGTLAGCHVRQWVSGPSRALIMMADVRTTTGETTVLVAHPIGRSGFLGTAQLVSTPAVEDMLLLMWCDRQVQSHQIQPRHVSCCIVHDNLLLHTGVEAHHTFIVVLAPTIAIPQ